jgi:hypothetical protein
MTSKLLTFKTPSRARVSTASHAPDPQNSPLNEKDTRLPRRHAAVKKSTFALELGLGFLSPPYIYIHPMPCVCVLGIDLHVACACACRSAAAYRDTSMKQEPHDDGYETSGDLEIRAQGDGQKLYNAMQASLNIKQEPPTHDPYSFVDEEAAAASQNRVAAAVGASPGVNLPAPAPKKRGRKKKLKPGEEE